MSTAVLLNVSLGLIGCMLVYWWLESHRHRRQLWRLALRVHVNGIRGKSTVSRMIAGMLREASVTTVAKTTGSAACVINSAGIDEPIHRRGAPTILEQVDVIQKLPRNTQAIVIECMALQPKYQRICESHLVQSNIGILTNVREDHQDVMGATLPQITQSLLNTCPRNGVLITAEQDVQLQRIMRGVANALGSQLIVADPEWVTDDELARFEFVSFKENVAVGLAVAAVLDISRNIALNGMVRAAPDPGALRIRHLVLGDKQVTWANLFAVNDRQSTIAVMDMLESHRTPDTTFIGLLNNRLDREDRALQFADIVTRDLRFDRLVALGAYEHVVAERIRQNGFPSNQLILLGEQRQPSLAEMLDRIILRAPTSHVLLVGLANIHTPQVDELLPFLEQPHQHPTEAAA